MLPTCNLAMILLSQPGTADATLVQAAACDVPLLDYARKEWIEASWERSPDADPATVSIASATSAWVSLDGERISRPDVSPWTLELSLTAGKHLLQIGEFESQKASSAVLFTLEPGEAAVWTVVPLLQGVDVLECGAEGWLEHRATLALADLDPGSRDWLARNNGVACLRASDSDVQARREHAIAGARSGWPEYAAAASDLARQADSGEWERWQRRQLRVAAVGRAFELGTLVGFGITEYVASREGLSLFGRGTYDRWGPRVAVGTALLSTALRREALVRGGQPTGKSAFLLGSLIASTSLLSLEDPRHWRFSGGARVFGASLALVQALQNEWSQRRMRKRLRVEQGAEG